MGWFQTPQQRAHAEARERYPLALDHSYKYSLWFQLFAFGSIIGLAMVCSPVGWVLVPGIIRYGSGGSDILATLLAGGVMALFALAWLALVIIGTGLRRRKGAVARDLDQRGALTQGVVIDRWISHDGDSRDRFVAFRYGAYVLRQRVSGGAYRRTGVGDLVLVRYLPEAPHLARLADRQ